MAKNKITSSFLIGLFVLIGIATFVTAIIWLGKDKLSQEAKIYVTYFDGSVDGLTIGTAVKYQGIKCGSISELSIAPDGQLIEVVMLLNLDLTVNENLRAQAAMSGIAGGKFIQLLYPKAKNMLKRHPKITFAIEEEYIKSVPTELSEITVGAQDIIKELAQIEYIKTSEKLYDLLDTLLLTTNQTRQLVTNEDLHMTLSNLSESSAELTGLLRKVDSLQIYDKLEITASNLEKMSENILIISETLDNKIESIQVQEFLNSIDDQVATTTNSANKVINTLSYQSSNALYSLTETLEEFKKTNKELQRTLRAFTESPTHTLFSNPPDKD